MPDRILSGFDTVSVGTADVVPNDETTAGDPPNGFWRLENETYGVWLSSDNNLAVWHSPPPGDQDVFFPDPATLDEITATYNGAAIGIGHWMESESEEKKGGRVDADIDLTADFVAFTVTGTITNIRGHGADPMWRGKEVTLTEDRTTTTSDYDPMSVQAGQWDYSLYGSAADLVPPNGITGYFSLSYSNGGIVGAFDAPRDTE